jgi:hypothetical protein
LLRACAPFVVEALVVASCASAGAAASATSMAAEEIPPRNAIRAVSNVMITVLNPFIETAGF